MGNCNVPPWVASRAPPRLTPSTHITPDGTPQQLTMEDRVSAVVTAAGVPPLSSASRILTVVMAPADTGRTPHLALSDEDDDLPDLENIPMPGAASAATPFAAPNAGAGGGVALTMPTSRTIYYDNLFMNGVDLHDRVRWREPAPEPEPKIVD